MERPTIEISAFCRRLRSKKYFFLEGPPREAADILDGSQACWCADTGMAVGSDGDVVDPEECQSGRRCFQAYGAS